MPAPASLPALEPLVHLCEKAGRAIMAVREAGFRVDAKADASPVTGADRAAHEVLAAGLVDGFSLPLLSEEGDEVAWERRRSWRRFWLIDPLDGTREFIDGFDDFTVNLALVVEDRAVLGVVHAPAAGLTWAGVVGQGAWRWRGGHREPIRVAPRWPPRVLASRAHLDAATRAWVAAIPGSELQRCGSSVKFCRIAEGGADLYPRFAPTCQWDTAAGQAVLEAAGGAVLAADTLRPLRCQQGESLINGSFIACADPLWEARFLSRPPVGFGDESRDR